MSRARIAVHLGKTGNPRGNATRNDRPPQGTDARLKPDCGAEAQSETGREPQGITGGRSNPDPLEQFVAPRVWLPASLSLHAYSMPRTHPMGVTVPSLHYTQPVKIPYRTRLRRRVSRPRSSGGQSGSRSSPLPRPIIASAILTGIGFEATPSRSRQRGKSLR
jgi:hypothetical protein